MDEAEYCDRISVMNRGEITVMGTPGDLKKEHGTDTIEELFIRIARDENNTGILTQKV
jgi:ABC-type multidrug transport system ATPase subunit